MKIKEEKKRFLIRKFSKKNIKEILHQNILWMKQKKLNHPNQYYQVLKYTIIMMCIRQQINLSINLFMIFWFKINYFLGIAKIFWI